MKPIDLDKLERLHAAATPGPWRECVGTLIDRENGIIVADIVGAASDPQVKADQRAIVALRNAFPALLAELRARRRQVEEARRAMRMVLDYRQGKKPFDFYKIADDYERSNQQFDSWQMVEVQIITALDHIGESTEMPPAKGGEGEK